jgi:hypothetical protein
MVSLPFYEIDLLEGHVILISCFGGDLVIFALRIRAKYGFKPLLLKGDFQIETTFKSGSSRLTIGYVTVFRFFKASLSTVSSIRTSCNCNIDRDGRKN